MGASSASASAMRASGLVILFGVSALRLMFRIITTWSRLECHLAHHEGGCGQSQQRWTCVFNVDFSSMPGLTSAVTPFDWDG